MLYSYVNESTLNTHQLFIEFVLNIQTTNLDSESRTARVCFVHHSLPLSPHTSSSSPHACVLNPSHPNPPPASTYSPKGQAPLSRCSRRLVDQKPAVRPEVRFPPKGQSYVVVGGPVLGGTLVGEKTTTKTQICLNSSLPSLSHTPNLLDRIDRAVVRVVRRDRDLLMVGDLSKDRARSNLAIYRSRVLCNVYVKRVKFVGVVHACGLGTTVGTSFYLKCLADPNSRKTLSKSCAHRFFLYLATYSRVTDFAC